MTRPSMTRLSILAAGLFLASATAALAAAAGPVTPGSSGGGDNPGTVGIKAPNPQSGKEIYQVICQSCHMADAKGGTGAGTIPALANNPKLAAPGYPILMVVKGRGAMPWFNDVLTPAQVAAVVGYIRTNFGNSYTAPVTAADVTPMWPKP